MIEDLRSVDPPVDRTRYAYYLASGIDESQIPDLDQAMLQQSSPEDYTPRYGFLFNRNPSHFANTRLLVDLFVVT